MRTARFILASAFALGLVACNDEEKDVDKALTLSLDSYALSLAAGETKTVTVTVRRPSSVTSNAALSASGAPAGVTVTLDPSSTADTSTLTVAATVEAAAATFNVQIIAIADTLAATSNLSVTVGQPAALSVSGQLFSAGALVVPAAVSIWGQGATTATAASIATDGTFTASGIVPPYDVRADQGSGKKVLYLGLTTASPKLIDSLSVGELVNSGAHISGNFGDAGGSAPAGSSTYVSARCPGGAQGSSWGNNATYDFELFGTLGTDRACTATALRSSYDVSTGNPNAWLGRDTKSFTASTTSTVTVSFTLAGPLASHVVNIDRDPAVGSAIDARLLWVTSPTSTISGEDLDLDASFTVPNDEAFVVYALHSNDDSTWLQTSKVTSSTNTAHIVAVPFVGLDAIETGVKPAAVKVTPYAGAPATLFYGLQSANNDWSIVTNGGFDAARLAARGLTLVDNQLYGLSVTAFFSQPTVDAFAAFVGINAIVVDGSVIRFVPPQGFVTTMVAP